MKIFYAILCVAIFCFSVCYKAVAQTAQDLPNRSGRAIFNPKKPTPSRLFSSYMSMPYKFGTSNNLTHKPGSFYGARGEVIFVQGKVTDSFNVPVTGVLVEIWQTNSAGKYHSFLKDDSDYVDEYFNMSGRTITDNLGNYYFVTVMPGAYSSRAPHINMNFYHQSFGKLETEMYFESHPLNDSDYQYLSYTKEDRKALTSKVHNVNIFDPTSTKICTFDVVMKGVQQYKGFGN